MKTVYPLLILLLISFQSLVYSQSKTLIRQFDIVGATATYVTGINDSGQIVGYYTNGSGNHGFFFDSRKSDTVLFDFPGAVNTWAYSISNDGIVAGQYTWTNLQASEGFWFYPNTGLYLKA